VHIAIAADHAGFRLKEELVSELRADGHELVDLGTHDTTPVDYPPLCATCGRLVRDGRADRGIVIGGSGQGEAMAANKVRGVRAALCHDETTARLARQHNDATVLALGARILAPELALTVTRVFLATDFEGGRHVPRLEELAGIEAEEAGEGAAGGSP
jgi:ribose 5-phosphate isomerase B